MKLSAAEVSGRVKAPPSKSESIRALVAAALAKGTSELRGVSRCLDAQAAAGALTALGASFAWQGDTTRVCGSEGVRGSVLDCGESALCMRMLAPVAAMKADQEIVLTASGSLVGRQMGMLEAPLRALGGQCTTDRGLAPVRVRGPLSGGRALVDASATSQLLSGLLFALPLCTLDSELEVPVLASAPYVVMTQRVLRSFGISIDQNAERRTFRIPGGQRFVPTQYGIEGDWSGAAFLLCAGAIAGQVEVTGLRLGSAQADARVLEVLELCGAKVERAEAVRVSCGSLRAFCWDVANAPDLLPPLAALACCCRGTTELWGIERTRRKESDRVASLCEGLGALGAAVQVDSGRMRITGGRLRGGVVDAHGDHRIAMAMAVAALRASGPVEIAGAGSVAKSYPSFFEDLRSLRT